MSRSAPLRRYRFTTSDYFRMGEAGIFPEDSHTELLDGEIVQMSPSGNRHEANHPTAADVLLLVEVSDSSFRIDVGLKSRLYR